ncbi:MAG: FAD-dependent oxidoreductase [Desulfuromonadaceae bacterium]|nr:FAD-dependent oxidoreductase [Desulfuromonadaceae bacterium]
MKKRDVVIIGGSAAGMMTATTVKRRYPDKQVTMIRNVSKTPVPCGIPYIYGTLKAVEKNIIPDDKLLAMGIEIIADHVERVERSDKTVHFSNEESLSYDKLVLATGSKPVVPPIPGVELDNVFTVAKDPFFLQRIFTALQQARQVVVIGGGFIGVEMAEQIAALQNEMKQGASVALVEMLPHCLLLACEEEFCIEAEKELQQDGVTLYTNSRVEKLEGAEGRVTGVKLADGRTLAADVVILGIGALPNIDLAEQMELEADPRLGIKVDDQMRTADPDIYSAGDCASKFSFFDKQPSCIRLASVAATEGLIAGSNLYADKPRRTIGALGAFATQIGARAIGAAGYTTRSAAAEGIEVVIGDTTAPNRHPGGLPGCIADMRVKMLFRKQDGVLIGGHVIGGEATADMANVIAVAIQKHMTAEELATMQYATHPLLTASPLTYHIMVAAELAAAKL